MKKAIALVLSLILCACTLTACGEDTKGEGVMTYAEYVAAPTDSQVVVETYVQATRSWWDGKITIYSQDKDGAYFLYDISCSEEDAKKLVPGTKIKVTGMKTEWEGEVEIAAQDELNPATFEIEDGNYVAEALDVTSMLGTAELDKHQNEFVSFKGVTIEASTDADGNEAPFLYNWDGSGEEGSDLYFNISANGQTYTVLIQRYLCDPTTDVYQTAKTLQIGDTVDLEGFLYWYNGANPHITKITIK
ncbi:MAG: hypothetical protein MJ133_04910 [Lachnospiraceae bacterium]|nr:hypothetical protein [Lachnospiraceae bacterium]